MDILGLRGDFGDGNRGMCRREVFGKPAFPFPELHRFRVQAKCRRGDRPAVSAFVGTAFVGATLAVTRTG
jgi:hypothetical protein